MMMTYCVFDTLGVQRMFITSNGDLNVDNATLFVDESTNRVGIGTNSPNRNLTVSGDAQVTGRLFDSSGDAGTAGQVLSSTANGTNWITPTTGGGGGSSDEITDADGDTRIRAESTADNDILRFETSGVERMQIQANGNIAMPSNLTVGTAAVNRGLTVNGPAQVTGRLFDSSGDTGTAGQVLSSTGTGINWITPTSGGGGGSSDEITDADGDTRIRAEQTNDEDLLRFTTSGVERMQIQANGNIAMPSNLTVGTAAVNRGLTVNGPAQVTGRLFDSSGDTGTAGQVLSSTGTGINWIDGAAAGGGLAEAPTLTAVGEQAGGTLGGVETIFVQGDYLYAVASVGTPDRFVVVDISDPTDPDNIATLTDNFNTNFDGATDLFVQGDYAYVTSDADDALTVIDISDPTDPTFVADIHDIAGTDLLDEPESVFVQGNYAYVATSNNFSSQGVFGVIDISDPTDLRVVDEVVGPGSGNDAFEGINDIFVQGNYAYGVVRGRNSFVVFDISDPTNISYVTSLVDNANLLLDEPVSVFVQGNYAYVASFTENGLQVIDIGDPGNPTGVGNLADTAALELDGARDVFVQGNYAYVTAFDDDGIQVIDISDPTNPTGVAQLTDDLNALRLDGAHDVFVKGNYAYVSGNQDGGIQVLELGQNSVYGLEVGALEASGLQVGNYAQFNNNVDIKGGLGVGGSAQIEGDLGVNGENHHIEGNVGIGIFGAPTHILHIQGQGRSTNANWATTSDERIKRNISNYTSGLDELLQVQPVSFSVQ